MLKVTTSEGMNVKTKSKLMRVDIKMIKTNQSKGQIKSKSKKVNTDALHDMRKKIGGHSHNCMPFSQCNPIDHF